MPAERLAMRKIYEILRLLWVCNVSMRATALSCRVARSTAKEYQVRACAGQFGNLLRGRARFRPPSRTLKAL